jgi:hypothetical protein
MESNAEQNGEPEGPSPLKQQDLRKAGFRGLVSFRELREGQIESVPKTGGVYVVLRESDDSPIYLEQSVGGWFKEQDPTVAVSALKEKWITGAHVIYIGKGDDLRRRLREFMNFGAGRPIGHRGGRYVWQLEGSEDLVVAWRETGDVSPRQGEVHLRDAFRKTYGGRLPFANLVG